VFVTGVAYSDSDNDDFYSIGEGQSNIRFSIAGSSANTSAAGGYSVSTTSATNTQVTVTHGGNTSVVEVDLSSGNVKLDLVGGSLFQTSGNLTLVSGVNDAELLGIGNQSLSGNAQNNMLTGNSGNNTISGGNGNDIVFDRAGNDNVDLGSGNDTVLVGNGADTLVGGAGIDNINYYYSSGGVNVDLFFNTTSGGWAADDVISGFERVYGSNTGNDILKGTNGNNILRGYGGNDIIFDRAGNDSVDLGDGNDTVLVGNGADTLVGGAGIDNVNYYYSTTGVNIDLFFNTTSGGWAADDVISGFERVFGSNVGNDILKGTNGDNFIRGYGGNDIVFDRGGNDIVQLGDGNDTVLVGNGADTMTGGAGIDNINYYYSTSGVSVDLLTNALSGGWAADDVISGFERVYGSNTGNDTLKGTDGDNFLRGYAGDDDLDGRGGKDNIDGGSGADRMTGGLGADSFVFAAGYQNDTITDFSLGEGDRLLLDDALWGGGLSASAVVSSFAAVVGSDVVFDFGGGDVLTLEGLTSTNQLDTLISII
ncbi:MAG: calcium-binding protein, partial [Albidovulum sp.]